MSADYTAKIIRIAEDITAAAQTLDRLKSEREEWMTPERRVVSIGGINRRVVRRDGSIDQAMKGIHQEYIKAIDESIRGIEGRIEGMRFKLSRLGGESK